MSYFLPICLSSLLLFGSCSDLPSGDNTDSFVDELAIRMERKGCYGPCPAYVLNIQPNGDMSFEGKYYTKTIGTVESKLNLGQLNELISAIRESDFFVFHNSYETGGDGCPTTATDMPTVVLTVRLKTQEKTVWHYHGCLENSELRDAESGKVAVAEKLQPYPRKLTRLEDRIDEIVRTKQWTGDHSDE